MKTILSILTLLAVVGTAQATLTQTFTPTSGAIPMGSPVGAVFNGNFTAGVTGDEVTGVTVGLNISGGYNGNLYAYLVAPNGTMVVLLNQPGVALNGFGASGAGMNITLQDGASDHGSIQSVTSGGVLSGSYNAAGALSGFGTTGSPGGPANGTWELFFADTTSGGGVSTLNSWSLDLTVVPEPVTTALAVFGGVVIIAGLIRWQRKNQQSV